MWKHQVKLMTTNIIRISKPEAWRVAVEIIFDRLQTLAEKHVIKT